MDIDYLSLALRQEGWCHKGEVGMDRIGSENGGPLNGFGHVMALRDEEAICYFQL